MNQEHHLQELRMKIEKWKNEPAQNWLGKWAKSLQVKKVEEQIRELEKQIKKKNNQ